MSKSEGNFYTIRELLEKFPGDVLRLQMLSTHYRQPLDWTQYQAEVVSRELEDWGEVLQGRYHLANDIEPASILEALSDDLNTPDAITALRDLFARAKKGRMEEELEFAAACKFLGFRKLDKPGLFRVGVSALNVGRQNFFKHSESVEKLRAAIANDASEATKSELLSSIRSDGLDVQIEKNGALTLVRSDPEADREKVDQLVADRAGARARKDWRESDRIRDELAKLGVELEDHKDGTTTWKLKRVA
jgi:cysteinyl-tRNA synthetase